MYFFIVLQLLLYILLANQFKIKPAFAFFAILYSIAAIVARYLVPLEANADYGAYYYNYGNYMEDNIPFYVKIFKEPYLFYIKRLLEFFFRWEEVIPILYYFNFAISTLFFIWLASLKDVALWKKIFFYATYYFLIAFTLIRNGPAYMLVTVFFYYIQRGKVWYWGYAALLMHISSVMALATSFFKNDKVDLRFFIFAFGGVGIIAMFANLPIFSSLLLKYDSYSTSDRAISASHYIFFTIFNLVVFFIFYFNKKIVYTKIFVILYLLCVAFFIINPVMFFRFSIYAISFLSISPTYTITKLDRFLNRCVILTVLYFVYNFIGNHPDLR
ncbi:hypothetical protein CQ046_04025 [Chryseobacterium sp. MYb7]|uniref:EpsG family protein n=1 Tax=Chryseobacterium sp. MYb7 TaxID=1827290 RepID=UPI000CFF6D68|nr:EpsG family protein [Chryseobacterium sp. MYb7]PRB05617.1 hypothetical protein CQ046_04025 [Chryseobacterium sp. MYb7]